MGRSLGPGGAVVRIRFGDGFIVANSVACALNGFPSRAGSVSALVGAMQYGSGIVGSGLVGAFANGTPGPMGWVIALAAIGSLLSTRLVPLERVETAK